MTTAPAGPVTCCLKPQKVAGRASPRHAADVCQSEWGMRVADVADVHVSAAESEVTAQDVHAALVPLKHSDQTGEWENATLCLLPGDQPPHPRHHPRHPSFSPCSFSCGLLCVPPPFQGSFCAGMISFLPLIFGSKGTLVSRLWRRPLIHNYSASHRRTRCTSLISSLLLPPSFMQRGCV